MTTIAELNEALKDRYVLEKEIGRGGMATVFLARDLRHNRAVALKVLPAELSAAIGSERFLREIDVTANLQHPHILPLFDSGTAAGQLFYVMPFIEGETLRARLDREHQLPVNDAVLIATEVADALAYAHKRNVIHRDIKPENILLQDGHALVADFGIALAVSNAAGERVTQTGVSLGTPQFMSPEQAAGERTVDGRSDVYSLGAVTYEMLAGEPPHRGNSVQATLAKVMTTPPQPLRALRSSVPANVAHAVEKTLAKLPADRFSSAEEFSDALANPAYASSAVIQPTPSDGWRHGTAPALAVGSALLLVAALWGWLRPAPAATVLRYELAPDASDAMSAAIRNTRIALSPDGSRLVYVGARNADLLVRSRDQLSAVSLPGTEGASAPVFSPDGDHVAFISGHAVKVSSIEGGTPITVTDALGSPNAVSWGPDNFLYTDDISRALQRVAPAAGAVMAPFTHVDTAAGEVSHVWPDALPGGRGVLFSIAYDARTISKTGSGTAIAVEDVTSHTHRVLIERAFGARYVATGHLIYKTLGGVVMAAPFDERTLKVTGEARPLTEKVRTSKSGAPEFSVSSRGRLVYVTGAAAEEMELVWVARDGKVQSIDPNWHSRFDAPAISPDGARVAVGGTTNDILIKPLNGGPAVNLTLDGKYNTSARWTPDGRSVTYQSLAGGSADLWTKRADGSAAATLQLHQPRAISVGLWSQDGSWLIFGTSFRVAGSGDILAIRPGRDSVATPLVATKFEEASPSLSPDGRWLAYSSNETGRREVYVVPFPDTHRAKWAVSAQGGSEPLWSHHGAEIYYRNGDGEMVAAEVRTKPTFAVSKSTVLFSAREFFASPNIQEYSVSPDDRRFLMMRPVAPAAADKMVVVENWFEELKAMSRPKK